MYWVNVYEEGILIYRAQLPWAKILVAIDKFSSMVITIKKVVDDPV